MNSILAFYGKTPADLTYTAIAVTASGTQHLHTAAVAVRGAILLALCPVIGSAATTLLIRDTAQSPVALSGTMNIAAAGGSNSWTPWGLCKTAAGVGIDLVAGSGGNVNGMAVSLIL
jgi:hypothetical protein